MMRLSNKNFVRGVTAFWLVFTLIVLLLVVSSTSAQDELPTSPPTDDFKGQTRTPQNPLITVTASTTPVFTVDPYPGSNPYPGAQPSNNGLREFVVRNKDEITEFFAYAFFVVVGGIILLRRRHN